MRINEIFLVENNTNQLSFIDYLHQAVENAQVGFWFEEGGCWGMALALYEKFHNLGYPAQLIVSYINKEPSHAMIESGGKFYDYTGETHIRNIIRKVTPLELLKIAEISGYEDISASKDDAMSIIENAVELFDKKTAP